MYRPLFVLTTCVGALTACGGSGSTSVAVDVGGPAEASIRGIVNGMPSGVTVLLKNGDAETLAVTGSGAFTFSKKVTAGADYNVTLVTKPSGHYCNVAGGSGIVAQGVTNISTVAVTCQSAPLALSHFNVGVTVSGLASGQKISFANGTSTLTVMGNGLHLFAENYVKQAIYAGRVGGYEVTVKTNPISQTCTLAGGSGALSLGDASNFVNLQVECK